MAKVSGVQQFFDYLLDVDLAICMGPVSRINGIKIKDRWAWLGSLGGGATAGQGGNVLPIPIEHPTLFGGDSGEGGPFGVADYYRGTVNQAASEALAERFNRTVAESPGYRRIAHVHFRGSGSRPSFQWTTNNPYFPETAFHVSVFPDEIDAQWQRVPTHFDPIDLTNVVIDGHNTPDLRGLENANPAGMIYRIKTAIEFGDVTPPSLMDMDSFNAAAEVLFNEKFGLAVEFNGESSADDMISEVLDHINGFMFFDQTIEKFRIKLVRNDYNVEDITKRFGPHNCNARNRKRLAEPEVINEIVVQYTNPITEQVESVAAQNLASIQRLGYVNSETRNYYMIRDKRLALKVANRDVSSAGTPLFSCRIETNMSAEDVFPGDVVLFSWPEDGIVDMPVRVFDIDYGDAESRQIVLDVAEDIFAFGQAEITPIQSTEWVPPDDTAREVDHHFFTTLPYPMVERIGTDMTSFAAEEPEVIVGVVAGYDSPPTPIEISLSADTPTLNGGSAQQVVGTLIPSKVAQLASSLSAEASSTIPATIVDGALTQPAEPGWPLLIGADEGTAEIVLLDSLSSGEWTVIRAVWDTIPREWPAGTPIRVYPRSSSRVDPVKRLATVGQEYKLLPRTAGGTLSAGSASLLTYTPTGRPFSPFRPANCALDGASFTKLEYLDPNTAPSEVEATWANRNRTLENAQVLSWDDISVAPESGQTTTLRVLDLAETEVAEITGLSGGSHNIPFETLQLAQQGWVEFVSVRGGLESIQNFRIEFDILLRGYGLNYGLAYG